MIGPEKHQTFAAGDSATVLRWITWKRAAFDAARSKFRQIPALRDSHRASHLLFYRVGFIVPCRDEVEQMHPGAEVVAVTREVPSVNGVKHVHLAVAKAKASPSTLCCIGAAAVIALRHVFLGKRKRQQARHDP